MPGQGVKSGTRKGCDPVQALLAKRLLKKLYFAASTDKSIREKGESYEARGIGGVWC